MPALRVVITMAVCVMAASPLLACAPLTPTEKAMSLTRQRREAEALALLKKDLAEHPDDLDARRLLIRLLAFTGDLPGARSEVAALASRLGPADPSPWIELGHALELSHKFEEAIAAYDTAAETAPTSPEGPREGGIRAARWGEWDEARSRLETAIARGARDEETFHTMGVVKLNLHDVAGARAAYEQGTRADPKAVDCWVGLATVALVAKDWEGALRAYDGVLARRTGFGDAELGRAWALARLGRVAEARRALDHAEELGASPSALAKQRSLLGRPAPPPSPPASVTPPQPTSPDAAPLTPPDMPTG